METPEDPALTPWIRSLILESGRLPSPRVVQLLEEKESDVPGPSSAPGLSSAPSRSDEGTSLLVSDGTHSVRCLVTPEALSAAYWDEKDLGFHCAEGRLLMLQDCEVRVHVSDSGMVRTRDGAVSTPAGGQLSGQLETTSALPLQSAEFYLHVNRLRILPTSMCREWVYNCNRDPEVRRKLYSCLEEHLSESATPSAGFSVSQLLNEVENRELGGALMRLAESCLMPSRCAAKPCPTRWASLRLKTVGEDVYTVSSELLHIPESDQKILSALDPGSRAQCEDNRTHKDRGPKLPTSDLTVQDLSQTETSSTSCSGAPPLSGHVLTEESVSLLPALTPAAPEPEKSSSSPPGPITNSPLSSCTPSLSPLKRSVSPQWARGTKAQKTSLCFKVGLPPKTSQPSASPRPARRAPEPSTVWNPPERHRDGSAFQYVYEPPCASLCAQVQATRLPSRLVAWAMFFLMESQVETEQTKV